MLWRKAWLARLSLRATSGRTWRVACCCWRPGRHWPQHRYRSLTSVWRFGTVHFNFCCNCGIMLLSPKTHFDDQACVPWWKAVTFSRYTCTSKALTCVSFKNGKFIWKVQYFRKTANHFIGQMNPYGSWACYFRICFNGKFTLKTFCKHHKTHSFFYLIFITSAMFLQSFLYFYRV